MKLVKNICLLSTSKKVVAGFEDEEDIFEVVEDCSYSEAEATSLQQPQSKERQKLFRMASCRQCNSLKARKMQPH